MADEKPTAFTTLQPDALADGDWLVGVDVSDTTDDAAGSDVKIPAWVAPRIKVLGTTNTVSSTTVAVATGLTVATGTGTFNFKYWLRMQSATATVSFKFAVNHTGTVTAFPHWVVWPSQGVTAATGVFDQEVNATTGNVLGLFASRTKNTTLGPGTDVDTTSADILVVIEGLMIVTVAGDLQLLHASETATNTSLMDGSHLILQRVA